MGVVVVAEENHSSAQAPSPLHTSAGPIRTILANKYVLEPRVPTPLILIKVIKANRSALKRHVTVHKTADFGRSLEETVNLSQLLSEEQIQNQRRNPWARRCKSSDL